MLNQYICFLLLSTFEMKKEANVHQLFIIRLKTKSPSPIQRKHEKRNREK